MKTRLSTALGQLRRVVGRRCDGGIADADLLRRYAATRDEAAFEVLVWRHGPMVLGVGRRVLRDAEDAEDVLQATFLALVRQAKSIGRGGLAGWLYRVAYRTALRARAQREKRPAVHQCPEDIPAPRGGDAQRRDALAVLDEELLRLPEKYRTPLVLSYLQGLTNQEVADRVLCPVGTVFTRLARGRELLRKRLVRRGATLAAGLLGTELMAKTASAAVRGEVVRNTLRAAGFATAAPATRAGAVSPRVATLAEAASDAARSGWPQFLGATLILLAVVAPGASLLALQESPPRPTDGQSATATEPPASPQPKPAAAPPATDPKADAPDRPKVVQVFPADGATDVNPVTEIRVRFDRPMKPSNSEIAWNYTSGVGFRPRGEMRYSETDHEFILPVRLTPGSKHELTVNSEGLIPIARKDYNGFRSDGGVAAEARKWSFTTAKPAAANGKPPRATSVDPPSNSEVALLTRAEMTFDRPMDPFAYGLTVPGTSKLERRPELAVQPDYDSERHCFTLLLRVPPNWNGELRFEGFRGADGVVAEPVTVVYRTLRALRSGALERRVERAARSADLRRVVEEARNARRALQSVTEDIVTTRLGNAMGFDWYQSYGSQGARFLLQGERKFLGEIDDIMGTRFRVGSDGEKCWFRLAEQQTVLPAREIAERNVVICDAFDARGTADAQKIINDLKLEYPGEATVRGRRCHRVRSWDVHHDIYGQATPVCEWYIDANNGLPVRVERAGQGIFNVDLTYARVNDPIPDAEFLPVAAPGVAVRTDEPLLEGYTKRFLNVMDGTRGGRMSVRWGMEGPKGETRSSGLD